MAHVLNRKCIPDMEEPLVERSNGEAEDGRFDSQQLSGADFPEHPYTAHDPCNASSFNM